jgi:hypothetical protein
MEYKINGLNLRMQKTERENNAKLNKILEKANTPFQMKTLTTNLNNIKETLIDQIVYNQEKMKMLMAFRFNNIFNNMEQMGNYLREEEKKFDSDF